MITFFTIPKRFIGHIDIIQRNAIRSWKLVHPGAEIILFGDDEGIAEFAAEEGLIHRPQIETNEFGTPLLSSAFSQAREISRNEVLCFVNADIIFFSDVLKATNIPFSDYLVVGPRHNADVIKLIDYTDKSWATDLRALVTVTEQISDKVLGSDYFIFPRNGLSSNVPPFAVGRPAWDNWMLLNARRSGVPLINAKSSIFDVHQNHDYQHVKKVVGPKWEGPEGTKNRIIALNEIVSYSKAYRMTFPDVLRSISVAETSSGEKIHTDIARVFQEFIFFLPQADHYMLPDGRIKRFPFKERFFDYCHFCRALSPDTPVRNRWACRIRNAWRKIS